LSSIRKTSINTTSSQLPKPLREGMPTAYQL
jgi:hypothetical protein